MHILLFFGAVVLGVTASSPMPNVPSPSRVHVPFTKLCYELFQVTRSYKLRNVVIAPYSMVMVISDSAVSDKIEYSGQWLGLLGFQESDVQILITYRSLLQNHFKNWAMSNWLSENWLFQKAGSELFTFTIENIGNIDDSRIVNSDPNQPISYAINDWFKQQSNSYNILTAIEPRDESTFDPDVTSANSARFAFQWHRSVPDMCSTSLRYFRVTSERCKKVPTMHQRGHYMHGTVSDFDASWIEIDLSGYQLRRSMLIIIPKKPEDIVNLRQNTYEVVNKIATGERTYTGVINLYLPLFEMHIQNKIDLAMKQGRSGYQVIQRLAISIDENGVNGNINSHHYSRNDIPLNEANCGPSDLDFNVNQPFVWVIQTNDLVPILMGVISDFAEYDTVNGTEFLIPPAATECPHHNHSTKKDCTTPTNNCFYDIVKIYHHNGGQ